MQNNLPNKNLMINHYLQELHVLSSEIIRIFNEIESIVHSYKPGMEGVLSLPNIPDKYFFIQPEVFTRIASIQVHSANIKKLLFPTPRKKGEVKYKSDYRLLRTDELQSYFDMNLISELKNVKARNCLEHYDERLDKISFELWKGTIDKNYHIIASDVILSSDGALYGTPYYLNCYIIDSKIYKNAEKESDIGKLVTEANHIYAVTKNDLNITTKTGTIIPIPQNLS